MRILIHGINYSPELVGIGKYTTELAEWMASQGHAVCVHAARPYYPHWSVPESYNEGRDSELLNGVEVNRHAIFVPSVPNGLARLRHHASWLYKSWAALMKDAKDFRPDVVIAIAPSLMGTPAALAVARRFKIPSVLHVQDFEVGAAEAANLVRSKFLLRMASAVESFLMRRFSFVTTISPAMQARLHKIGVPRRRTEIIRNWADVNAITPKPQELSEFRESLELPPGSLVLLYSGSISRKQGLDTVLEAARLLEYRIDIRFLICGEGPSKQHYAEHAAEQTNVTFGPFQPLEKLGDLLAAADIHLLPQIAGAADLVLPSKLTGMLASGRPVIATTPGGSGLADEVSHVGLVSEPEDHQKLADAILQLADAPLERERLGVLARRRAEEVWAKETILTHFEAYLAGCVANSVDRMPSDSAQPKAL